MYVFLPRQTVNLLSIRQGDLQQKIRFTTFRVVEFFRSPYFTRDSGIVLKEEYHLVDASETWDSGTVTVPRRVRHRRHVAWQISSHASIENALK